MQVWLKMLLRFKINHVFYNYFNSRLLFWYIWTYFSSQMWTFNNFNIANSKFGFDTILKR